MPGSRSRSKTAYKASLDDDESDDDNEDYDVVRDDDADAEDEQNQTSEMGTPKKRQRVRAAKFQERLPTLDEEDGEQEDKEGVKNAQIRQEELSRLHRLSDNPVTSPPHVLRRSLRSSRTGPYVAERNISPIRSPQRRSSFSSGDVGRDHSSTRDHGHGQGGGLPTQIPHLPPPVPQKPVIHPRKKSQPVPKEESKSDFASSSPPPVASAARITNMSLSHPKFSPDLLATTSAPIPPLAGESPAGLAPVSTVKLQQRTNNSSLSLRNPPEARAVGRMITKRQASHSQVSPQDRLHTPYMEQKWGRLLHGRQINKQVEHQNWRDMLTPSEQAMSPMELERHLAKQAVDYLLQTPDVELKVISERNEGWGPSEERLWRNAKTANMATSARRAANRLAMKQVRSGGSKKRRLGSPARRRVNDSGEPNDGSGGGGGGRGGPKRPAFDDDEPDHRHLKRARKSERIDTEASVKLHELKPQPLRSMFLPHPLQDRDNEWFITQFQNLFSEMDLYVRDYFGAYNLDEGSFHQPWVIDLSPEFLNYVTQVAEPDNNNGGWDEILCDSEHRMYLIKGILMKVLEYNVFDAELWGASKAEEDMMIALEKGLLTHEGFTRQGLRAEQVRTIIGNSPTTRHFWQDVSKLTAQITLMLRPLSEYLYSLPHQKKKLDQLIKDQVQALHNIVAKAAYISIAIRHTPSIIFFSTASPGERYDEDDHLNIDEGILDKSKRKVVNRYENAIKPWITAIRQLKNELAQLEPDLLPFDDPKTDQGRAQQAKIKALQNHKRRPKPLSRGYHEMVKIGITPTIRRFKPGGSDDDDVDIPLEMKNGFRIREILKAQVVCYYGRDIASRSRLPISLQEVVMRRKARYHRQYIPKTWGDKGAAVVAGVVIALGGLRYFGLEPVHFRDQTREFISGLWDTIKR